MFRNIVTPLLILCFVVLPVQKAFSVPLVTTPAAPIEKKAGPETQKQEEVKADDSIDQNDKGDNNPAKKSVINMLNGFQKMSDNKQRYLEGKQAYDQYMHKDRRLSAEVSTHIDFWDVCEKSFRKDHWAKKSQEDKTSFTNLFIHLIEEIVYPIANDYFNDLSMTHKLLESKKDYVHIKTIVKNAKKRKNREFIMDWFLHQSANGGWVVYDVGVEGEMWVEGFRSQFNDVITKKSYKELIKMMKKKLVEVKEDRLTDDKKDFEKAKKDRALAKVDAAKGPVQEPAKEPEAGEKEVKK
jgi:ABC-type transporter MlaC component